MAQAAILNSIEDTLNLTNVTITNNTATLSPSNSDVFFNFGIINVKNSILASSDGSPVICQSTPPVSQGHNIESDNDCGLNGPGDQVEHRPGPRCADQQWRQHTELMPFSSAARPSTPATTPAAPPLTSAATRVR